MKQFLAKLYQQSEHYYNNNPKNITGEIGTKFKSIINYKYSVLHATNQSKIIIFT